MPSTLQPVDIVLAVAVVAALIGIFIFAKRRKKIHIGKSHVSKKDASSILQLFAADTKLFDFKLRESTDHAVVSLHSCVDGQWMEPLPLADFTDLEAGKYRLIVRRVLTAIDLYLCSESDYDHVVHIPASVSAKRLEALNLCETVSQYELSGQNASVGESNRSALWVILGCRTGSVTADANYTRISCDSGFAITLHFE